MSFEDFCENFSRLNVCKLGEYSEFNFKSEFEVKSNEFNKSVREVYCKNYYEIKVEEKATRVSIGIH